MTRRWVLITTAGAACMVAALVLYSSAGAGMGADQAAAAPSFKEIRWEALIPKDWDPVKRFQNNNRGIIDDSDPYAQRLMRAIWDNAPTVAAMDDAAISLQGYVVPLEESKEGLKEFLLVPYFGACLHSPPPPANQIVHVLATPPVKGVRTMDVVWVSGTLATTRRESSMGMSGYDLKAVAVSVSPRP